MIVYYDGVTNQTQLCMHNPIPQLIKTKVTHLKRGWHLLTVPNTLTELLVDDNSVELLREVVLSCSRGGGGIQGLEPLLWSRLEHGDQTAGDHRAGFLTRDVGTGRGLAAFAHPSWLGSFGWFGRVSVPGFGDAPALRPHWLLSLRLVLVFPRLILVLGELQEVQIFQSLRLFVVRQLDALVQFLPNGAEMFGDFGVVHFGFGVDHAPAFLFGPGHERVHGPLDLAVFGRFLGPRGVGVGRAGALDVDALGRKRDVLAIPQETIKYMFGMLIDRRGPTEDIGQNTLVLIVIEG